jgi:hypothetical protein
MDAIERIRHLEAQVLQLLCDLMYDDTSREWQLTVNTFAQLTYMLYQEHKPEPAITEIIRTIREQNPSQ